MARTADPSALKRAGAGSYRTADGRFSVEQASGRWLVIDSEQRDELGLPLTRGPFATLDAARSAIGQAREGPAPESELAARATSIRRQGSTRPSAARSGAGAERRPEAPPVPPPVPPKPEIRTYRTGEGAGLRALWSSVGFRSLGDDDESLDRLADRNPGLIVVAEVRGAIVGTALGAWDGRRGWLYHVAVAEAFRRTGLGRRMVHEVERRLRALGCPKVNLIVRDDNPEAARFWAAMGYSSPPARQYGKEL